MTSPREANSTKKDEIRYGDGSIEIPENVMKPVLRQSHDDNIHPSVDTTAIKAAALTKRLLEMEEPEDMEPGEIYPLDDDTASVDKLASTRAAESERRIQAALTADHQNLFGDDIDAEEIPLPGSTENFFSETDLNDANGTGEAVTQAAPEEYRPFPSPMSYAEAIGLNPTKADKTIAPPMIVEGVDVQDYAEPLFPINIGPETGWSSGVQEFAGERQPIIPTPEAVLPAENSGMQASITSMPSAEESGAFSMPTTSFHADPAEPLTPIPVEPTHTPPTIPAEPTQPGERDEDAEDTVPSFDSGVYSAWPEIDPADIQGYSEVTHTQVASSPVPELAAPSAPLETAAVFNAPPMRVKSKDKAPEVSPAMKGIEPVQPRTAERIPVKQTAQQSAPQKTGFWKKLARGLAFFGLFSGATDQGVQPQMNGSTAEELAASMPRVEQVEATTVEAPVEAPRTPDAAPTGSQTRGVINAGEGVSHGLLHARLTNGEMQHVLNQKVQIGDTLTPLRDTYVISKGGELAVTVDRDATNQITSITFQTASGTPLNSADLAHYLKVVPHEQFLQAPAQSTATVDVAPATVQDQVPATPINAILAPDIDHSMPQQITPDVSAPQPEAPVPMQESKDVFKKDDEDDVVLDAPEFDADDLVLPEIITQQDADDDVELTPIKEIDPLFQLKTLKEYFAKSPHKEINFGGTLLMRPAADGNGFEIRYSAKDSVYRPLTPEFIKKIDLELEQAPKPMSYEKYKASLPEDDLERTLA